MITPYINFNGNCEEAFEYYSEVFQDGKPIIAKYGNSLGINKEYKYIDNVFRDFTEEELELFFNLNKKISNNIEIYSKEVNNGK